MGQDPKIIYKTSDPKVQKILDTANGTNMTPNVSEVEAKQVRNKYDATSSKPTMVNDSTSTKPGVHLFKSGGAKIVPQPKVSMLQKLKNFFNN